MSSVFLNNSNYDFHEFYMTQYEDPKEFFQFCLDNKLYKEEPGFCSRMKNVYLGKKSYEGISAIVTYHDDKPVGICLLEHFLENNCPLTTQAGILHMDSRTRKNPWKIHFSWNFIHLGFMSFYVDEKHRKNGLATQMLKQMEKLNLPFMKQYGSDNVFIVTAKELAYDVVQKSSFFHATKCQPFDGNYKKSISNITYDIYFNDKNKKTIDEITTHHKSLGHSI